MKYIEDIDVTTKERIQNEQDSGALYVIRNHVSDTPSYLDTFNRRNAIHLDLAFGREIIKTDCPVVEMYSRYARFWDDFFRITGLKHWKVAHAGYLFTVCESGSLWPHIHQVVYSPKDRQTKKSIGKLNANVIHKLNEAWVDQGNDSLHVKQVFDFSSLLAYFASSTNMAAPGQRWLSLPTHNFRLFERRAIAKTKIATS